MDRRDTLKSLSLLSAHALFPSVWASFLSSCSSKEKVEGYKAVFFTDEDLAAAAEIANIIFPATDTPSASEAGVHIFVEKYVMNCYDDEQQRVLVDGLRRWQKNAALSEGEKAKIIAEMDRKAYANGSDADSQFFRSFKSLTVLGYFFSERGAAAADYVPVPGRFEGCIDLKPGQKVQLLNSMT